MVSTTPDAPVRRPPAPPGPPHLSPRRRDLLQWAIALGLTALSLGYIVYLAQDFWFTSDMWDFLVNRKIGSVQDVLGSRGANWTTPTVVMIRFLYGVAEMDFWPWYFLPRLIGYSVLALWLWRVMLRREADPVIAMAALAVLLFFGPSAYLQGAFMGHVLSISMLFAAAWMIHANEQPGRAQRWWLFAFLVLGLMSNTPGVAAYFGVAVVLVVTLGIRQWWQPLLGAGGVYAVWWLLFMERSTRGALGLGPAEIADLPAGALSIIEAALPRVLAVAPTYGASLAVVLVSLLLWQAATGRLDAFDAIVLTAAGGYLALVVIGRVLPGSGAVTSTRYAYHVGLMLIPVLVPKIRIPKTPQAYAVALAVAFMLWLGHATTLETGLGFWAEAGQETRARVETAAALIADGEPRVLPRTAFHRFARPLTPAGVEQLLNDGWQPERSADPATVEAARGALRMAASRGTRASGAPLLVESGVRPDGCVVTEAGQTLVGTVDGSGTVVLRGPQSTITTRWEDEFGVGTMAVDVSPQPVRLRFADPVTTAKVELTAGNQRFVICGVAEGG